MEDKQNREINDSFIPWKKTKTKKTGKKIAQGAKDGASERARAGEWRRRRGGAAAKRSENFHHCSAPPCEFCGSPFATAGDDGGGGGPIDATGSPRPTATAAMPSLRENLHMQGRDGVLF